uniref:Uncharacterized protein n=2 Tax=Macaca TaxID=9539 RepID=A0A5F8AG14_MACMU
MVPYIPAAPDPAMAKKGQGTCWAVASQGVNPKPWWLANGVGPAGAQKTRIEVWEPLPRFQRIYGCPARSLLQGQSPHREPLLGQFRGRNVGLEPPQRVPTRTLSSGAVRRRPPSFRPQNGRSTESLHHVPGKAADTQCQPMKAAGREAVPCKATGAELPKTMGTYLLH